MDQLQPTILGRAVDLAVDDLLADTALLAVDGLVDDVVFEVYKAFAKVCHQKCCIAAPNRLRCLERLLYHEELRCVSALTRTVVSERCPSIGDNSVHHVHHGPC